MIEVEEAARGHGGIGMSDVYQLTADKFIFKVLRDRKYSEKDVWAKTEDGVVRLGVTDFYQRRGGDIVYIELPEVGKEVKKQEEISQFETIKAILSIDSPVDGTITEVNEGLQDKPERINEDPYGDGWIAVIKPTNPEDLKLLLPPEKYFELMKSKVEIELEKARR